MTFSCSIRSGTMCAISISANVASVPSALRAWLHYAADRPS